MRRFIALVTLIALMVMAGLQAEASIKAYASIIPNMSINGTTATCSLVVLAGNASDTIEATVVIKRGSVVVQQWTNLSASGYMNFNESLMVSRGNTYTMQVALTINGVLYSVDEITRKCN